MTYASQPWGRDRAELDELLGRPGWQANAACRGTGPDLFFPSRGGSTAPAKALCARCDVREECERYAEETGSGGVWAGKGRKQRYTGMIVSSGNA